MIGCEEKRTADAEFADQILCHNAVQWSKDNRISVCTEKGISIMVNMKRNIGSKRVVHVGKVKNGANHDLKDFHSVA